MSDRFHRAARDGYLDLLRETTRKDCNSPDEDGMTPTLWAAYHGHLDALRLLVGRGGNPDKCDHYGNTALHWAAANGHMNCVSFLVNFGVNLWSLDNDFHTGKDRAAMGAREEILRFLDDAMAKQTALNRKQVAAQKEKAVTKAEKRVKDYQNIQKKAAKKAEEDEKRLMKERQRMEGKDDASSAKHKIFNFNSIRRDSRLLYSAPATFNEIVGSGTTTKKSLLGVHKKIATRKKDDDAGEFKVAEKVVDGMRSTRSLAGLRRDSDIMYVPKYDTWDLNSGGQKRRLQDVFNQQNASDLARSKSESEILHEAEKEEDDDEGDLIADRPSIFDRPGFGNVAFRQSIAGSLLMSVVPTSQEGNGVVVGDNSQEESTPWGEEDPLKDDEEEDDSKTSPLFFFLSAHGLVEFFPRFLSESVDLDALMLLTEEDLIDTFQMPLGPRRKLLKAIDDRRSALEEPGEITDSRL